MGEITPYLDLYKPEGSELVDVVTHLNNNSDKIDDGVSALNSRVTGIEGVAGLVPWVDFTPTFTFGGVGVAVTWERKEYQKVGDIVTMDIKCTLPNALYDDGASIGLTLPKRAVSNITGTGLLEKDPNVNPALAGIKAPYFYVTGPSGAFTTSAVAYPLINTPPIEIDWEAPHDSATYTAIYSALFSYRTDEA